MAKLAVSKIKYLVEVQEKTYFWQMCFLQQLSACQTVTTYQYHCKLKHLHQNIYKNYLEVQFLSTNEILRH